MTDSASITVTNHRLRKAMSNANDDDLKSHAKKVGEELKSELKLRLGEILKIYPYRDKCEVRIKGTSETETCLIAHDILSEGMNVSGFPKGRVTHEKAEEVIIPSETIYGIILDVDIGGKNQKCIVSYINIDRKHTPNNAHKGEYKIQVGKNVISLTDKYININSDNLFINGLPYTEAYKPLVDYHDKEEIGNIVTEIDDNLTEVNDKLDSIPQNPFDPKTIKVGDNLNNYIIPGLYYCPRGTVATSLLNCPVVNAFSLFVEKPSEHENACTQSITSYDGTKIKKFSRFIQTIDGTLQNSGWQPIYEDTGWKDVIFSSGFTHHSDADRVRYRRVGKVVELRGTVKNTNQLSLSSTDTTFTLATISDTSCRPSKRVIYRQQGSQMNTFLVIIDTNGAITLSRYGTTSITNVPASSWLNVHTTFLVE